MPKSGAWKPQVHFVWDMLLDRVLSTKIHKGSNTASFPDFFRIVVDGAPRPIPGYVTNVDPSYV